MTTAATSAEREAFFHDAPCAFISTSTDGAIQLVNRTFVTMSGYSADELIGRRLWSLLTVGGRIYIETHLAPLLLESGQLRGIALELIDAAGDRIPILLSATVTRGEAGRPTGIRVAMFDATERRAYETELLAARTRAEASDARARQLVRSLQQTLIPPVTPTVAGLDLAAAYRPAGDGSEVGGDFYDVFQIGHDDWIVAVGDVTGKGAEAAAVTALARYTIRAAAVITAEPEAILTTLNDVLRQDDMTTRWCSVVMARLTRDTPGWIVEVIHAGHPLAVLVPAHGRVIELGRPGTILGAVATADLTPVRRSLGPGEAVVLYTDGVTEGRGATGFFGEDRLRAVLQEHRGSANGLTYRLLDDVVDLQAGRTSDDIVIVTIRVPSTAASSGQVSSRSE